MYSRFSYFDFISYLIPGTLVLWIITLTFGSLPLIDLEGESNVLINSLVFIVLAFVLGHLVQAFGKWILEKIIQFWWWQEGFFSEIYLLKDGPCADFKRKRFIEIARDRFKFDASQIDLLEKENSEDSRKISHAIYRAFDAFSKDNGLGEKAHTANAFYNFFRGLSAAFFLSALILLGHRLSSLCFTRETYNGFFLSREILLLIIFVIAAFVFLKRAKERGELYIAGVFDSVLGYFSK